MPVGDAPTHFIGAISWSGRDSERGEVEDFATRVPLVLTLDLMFVTAHSLNSVR